MACWLALSLTFTLIAGAAAVGLALIGAMRTRRAELRVTNLEYVSRGTNFTGLFHASQNIPRADVQSLEYQEDKSGPEWDHPGGVYAKLKRRSVCILPHVDANQAAAVIERIGTKFVDLGDNGGGESGFGDHFTSLRL